MNGLGTFTCTENKVCPKEKYLKNEDYGSFDRTKQGCASCMAACKHATGCSGVECGANRDCIMWAYGKCSKDHERGSVPSYLDVKTCNKGKFVLLSI